ncbi:MULTISPECIES: transposase [unclassified Streptomyces]|uniref:transposase n=1 Tax=unclassified Streptomyces TaxID=2593676 RepID=UPI0040415680
MEGKNCRQSAEQAGHARPGVMQRLLRSARWDADGVRDEVRSYVLDHLGGDGVLIVNETGFPKSRGSEAATVAAWTTVRFSKSRTLVVQATART